MDRIATDISGPFPVTEQKNKYILVVVDQFTKWVEAYAIPDQLAETVACKIVYEFTSRMGLPLDLHSDRGSNYTSKLFSEVCRILEVNRTLSSPYHPSSNGMVERFHHTLLGMISAYVSEHQRDWDKHLPLLTSAYRSCVHESTGFSPNMLMLGREVHQPITLKYGFPGESRQPVSTVDYACELWDRMTEIQHLVRAHLKDTAGKQKRDHDTRLSINSYTIGDLVYCLDSTRKIGRCPKLNPNHWKGPFVVIKAVSDLLYKISGQYDSKTRVMHHDRLNPYYSDMIPDWVPAVQKKAKSSNSGGIAQHKQQTVKPQKKISRTQDAQRQATGSQPQSPDAVMCGNQARPQRTRKQPDRLNYE